MRKIAIVIVIAMAAVIFLLWWGGALQWPGDPTYVVRERIGEYGHGPGQFDEPTGIAVHEGLVYVADARNARIQVFDSGYPHRIFGQGVLKRPMNLSIRDGRLYVADYFTDSIEVFGLDGAHHRSIRAADGLNSPGGVDAFADGSVLVADTYNHRIVHLDPDGNVLRQWGETGVAGRGHDEFRYPTDVAVLPGGGFVVAGGYAYRFKRFDADGRLQAIQGGPFALGIPGGLPGWFNVASSIALAPAAESVFIVDMFNQRVQRFSMDGELLGVFGRPPVEPGRSLVGIDVADDGTIWTTDMTRHEIVRWTVNR
ncbi:MAG: 6-bladed beta-propeller [Wenzhouxiangellaceae bacterium]|nr:6-bladed beta-propeller [Wenzhouxiangellaceae bacterium]